MGPITGYVLCVTASDLRDVLKVFLTHNNQRFEPLVQACVNYVMLTLAAFELFRWRDRTELPVNLKYATKKKICGFRKKLSAHTLENVIKRFSF